MTTTDPSTVTKRAWFDLAPDDTSTPDGMALRFALMGLAHSQAFSERISGIFTAHPEPSAEDQGFADAIRANNRANLMPYIAAFTAAALAKGWTPDKVDTLLEKDPEVCEDYLCDWIEQAGIDPWSVASADDIITTGHGLGKDEWDRLRGLDGKAAE